jgi:hypothetical protein
MNGVAPALLCCSIHVTASAEKRPLVAMMSTRTTGGCQRAIPASVEVTSAGSSALWVTSSPRPRPWQGRSGSPHRHSSDRTPVSLPRDHTCVPRGVGQESTQH